jgi:hypothetical protein
VKRDLLSGVATFLQRLLVGWTRSSGVKLVPFSEGNRQMFSARRRSPILATRRYLGGRRVAQGDFPATILVLMAFGGKTMRTYRLVWLAAPIQDQRQARQECEAIRHEFHRASAALQTPLDL